MCQWVKSSLLLVLVAVLKSIVGKGKIENPTCIIYIFLMSKRKRNKKGIVYSTEQGRMCPDCGKSVSSCDCRLPQHLGSDGIVRISRVTKGRKGKGVSLVSGLELERDELQVLAKELKQKCGTGGTVKSGIIEIQGDHRDKLLEVLKQQGYTVKLSGG